MAHDPHVRDFIQGILVQSKGVRFNGMQMFHFLSCRSAVKEKMQSVEGIITGYSDQVINLLLKVGDDHLHTHISIALNFYREAMFLCPYAAIFYLREAQCQLATGYFDLAKRACIKGIQNGGDGDVNLILEVMDSFVDAKKFKEAKEICLHLLARFPMRLHLRKNLQEIECILELEKSQNEDKTETKATKESEADTSEKAAKRNVPVAKVAKTSEKPKQEAIARDKVETSEQNATPRVPVAKVTKTSKQIKQEAMAREKEIQRNIAEARKKQEEKLKRQEVEAQKRKEQEELLKVEKKEKEKAQPRQQNQNKLNKTAKRGGRNRASSSAGESVKQPSKPKTAHPKPTKTITLDEMTNEFDKTLASGSRLRCICPKCNTPRVFSCDSQKCHACQSDLVTWYKKTGSRDWIKPRAPPNGVRGLYLQCKHFRQGKQCIKLPCRFAHGKDELEIWELYRDGRARVSQREERVYPLEKSASCMTLNSSGSGVSSRYRTPSLTSLNSWQPSNQFDLLSRTSSPDFASDSDEESLSCFSHDGFGDLSQDSHGYSENVSVASSFSDADSEMMNGGVPGDGVAMDEMHAEGMGNDQDDDGWITVGRKQAKKLPPKSKKKKKRKKARANNRGTAVSQNSLAKTDSLSMFLEQEKRRCPYCDMLFSSQSDLQDHYSDAQHKINVVKKLKSQRLHSEHLGTGSSKFRPPPDGVYMGRYKLCERFVRGYCYLGDKCTFAHGKREQAYWIECYKRQADYLARLESKQLIAESFSEKVRRMIKNEGISLLKQNLPGVDLFCNSPYRVKLDEPQDYTWIFEVRIQENVVLNQVAFLLETHLDKFQLLRTSPAEASTRIQSFRFQKQDFVEDAASRVSAAQFCVKFVSRIFGNFEQKLVFDFGQGSVLARTLFVSVISKDICESNEDAPVRTTFCHVLEWSVEKMELIFCRDGMPFNSDGLCEKYSVPNSLPDPAGIPEFTRVTYCKFWHDILFIEEQHIQTEVARYDISDGAMVILNSFQNGDAAVFALAGELFGEITLTDYLVMDEAAGHLISRSVNFVILRPKEEKVVSRRIYECCVKLKTSLTIIVKVNEELCKDLGLKQGDAITVDVKFRYNRRPMCEMHEAIDLCRAKTKFLLPEVKNVSHENKKSIADWFMTSKPNSNQHEAIAMILDSNPSPPILVIGPFGTGKTFTLNLACEVIVRKSKQNKVLICTHSNSAADIHLRQFHAKLQKKPSMEEYFRPLRVLNLLGDIEKTAVYLRKYCLVEEGTNRIMKPISSDVRDHNVIITTLATSRLLWEFCKTGQLRFTHILIDEAAQALEPECMIALAMADEKTKIVLAGDHQQMSPPAYSKQQWSSDAGPGRSLLERLFYYYNKKLNREASSLESDDNFVRTPYVVLLTENYRSHAKILRFPSECFYGGKLVAKGDQSAHELVPVLSFYAAQGMDEQVEGSLSYYNEAEIAEIAKRVQELIDLWRKSPGHWEETIGVLTPYRDQVKRIRDGLRKKGLGRISVETVENVQGKEFRALFISTVRTMYTCSLIENRTSDPENLDFGFLSDHRLLNTAVTRAQSLLAVVGDPMSLCSVGTCRDLWKHYLKCCAENNGLHGCTLKTVMDFCLGSQLLDPSASEFIPRNRNEDDEKIKMEKSSEISASVCSVDGDEMVSDSSSHRPSPASAVLILSTDTKADLAVSAIDGEDLGGSVDTLRDQNGDSQSVITDDRDTRKGEKNAIMKQHATHEFFRLDDDGDFDQIIEALVKACEETERKNEVEKQEEEKRNEEFPLLSNQLPTVAQSPPSWPNVSSGRRKRVFARVVDGRMELKFTIKESEQFIRLTRGKPKEGSLERCDIEEYTPDDLLKLLAENPGDYTKCTFRIGSKGRHYGQLPSPESPDICLMGKIRGVYEDDVIVAQRFSGSVSEKNGAINVLGLAKGVLRRPIKLRERQFVCTVSRMEPSVMVPINKNVPKMKNFTKPDEVDTIPTYTLDESGKVIKAKILKGKLFRAALAGECLFVVKLLRWRMDCPYPLGLAVTHLPRGHDLPTGMQVLYEEHNIQREFTKAVRVLVKRDFSKAENWQPPKEKGRNVYRNNVFTVDPPESRDLDDAISIRLLGNGNYQLQIHIADVSYFVRQNSPLDEEARLRGTSYYPPKPAETIPMLPRQLSEGCCSLLEGKDRLAISVIVEVQGDGTIVGDAKIERSLVRNCCRLTYHEAQQIIDETRFDADENGDSPGDDSDVSGKKVPQNIKKAIMVIHRIAQGRRRVRLGVERSLYHNKSDDEENDGKDVEAHEMIAEIMILTNHLVAEFLLKKYPTSTPLRVQAPPKKTRVDEFTRRFQEFLPYSLGIEPLGDAGLATSGNNDIKIPAQTWSLIKAELCSEGDQNSQFHELVKLVCDLDLFPQLALAKAHQQRLQQRGHYICSGETFDDIIFTRLQHAQDSGANVPSIASETVSPSDSEMVLTCFRQPSDREDGNSLDTEVANDVSVNEPRDGENNLPRGEEIEEESEKTSDDPVNVLSSSRNSLLAAERSPGIGIPSVGAKELVQAPANESRPSSTNFTCQRSSYVLHGHWSLKLDAYCHFTSPIRRYIDIVVHRLVVAAIEKNDLHCLSEPEEITAICDRCTFLARNAKRFDKDARKLRLAVNLQSSASFASGWIDEIARDSLTLFFGPGELDSLREKERSVPIARLGPDKDPVEKDGRITLQWTFRFLRLIKGGLSQPGLFKSEDEQIQEGDREAATQVEGKETSDQETEEDDSDLTVNGEVWGKVLHAVKTKEYDSLKQQLMHLDKNFRKRKTPGSSTKVTLLKRLEDTPSLSTNAPYQHPNTGMPEPSVEETVDFLGVTRTFAPCDRVKVQFCSQMSRGILSPKMQLFEIEKNIHVCVEHRTFPTVCFAKPARESPSRHQFSDIGEYVELWKPVLMMEIATSAVSANDVITLSNVQVKFAREASNEITLAFDLFKTFCETHYLNPLELNLMCVRVKDPGGKGKDAGFWIGHFQINAVTGNENEEPKENALVKAKARLIQSSTPIPESLIKKIICYVTIELIYLGIPERRHLGALRESVNAPDLIQDICTRNISDDNADIGKCPLPKDLSLSIVNPNLPFYPLNPYQEKAVRKALTKKFSLIQGPPGTGKTVTGVHLAYWFATLNRQKKPVQKKDGEKPSVPMVFYCGPSNKSVDLVARYLLKIPGLKILRIYGQEIERKIFPVPDKVTSFRSKRVAAQLKADDELKDVSLHHVIRSNECPFAPDLREFDMEFDKCLRNNENAPRRVLLDYNKMKSVAEHWAITESGVNIVLATCTTAFSPRIPAKNLVSQCIVDECGMCIEAETLCPMLGSNAQQVVLIGDHKQLQPVIKCDKARELGLEISMFERFSKRSQMLEIQYRMHEELCSFPSQYFYDGKLQTGHSVKSREVCNLSLWPKGSGYPFVFHHVVGKEESLVVSSDQGNENSKKNQREIDKVVYVTRTLTNEGVKQQDIVVLSPYRAQCFEIAEKLKQHGLKDISFMSVVASQGSEKDYVILSLVRSLPEKEIETSPSRAWIGEHLGFLTDEHQINVALTRAKRGLCIIGNATLLGVCSMWKNLLNHYEEKGCLVCDAPR